MMNLEKSKRQDKPLLVAHRGYAKNYPENTFSAFAAAIDCGGRFLELDVQLTRDHVACVIHDDNLVRTGSKSVSVLDSDWVALKGWPVGENGRLNGKFSTEPIVSLNDFVAFLQKNPGVHAFIEIKEESVSRFGSKVVLGAVLSELLFAREQCSIISYNHHLLNEIKKISDFPIGFILHAYDAEHQKLACSLKPNIIICNYQKIPDEDGALWQGDWEWMIYEVTAPEVARKWFNRGVKYIETMAFSEMMSALNAEAHDSGPAEC